MKRAYQIDERKAIDRFRSYLNTKPGSIQLVLPLAEVAQRLRHGVSQMLFETERDLLLLIMSEEIGWLSKEHGMRSWGTAPGSVIIHGQKVPVERTPYSPPLGGGPPGCGEPCRAGDRWKPCVLRSRPRILRYIAWLPDWYIEAENPRHPGRPVSTSPVLPRWFLNQWLTDSLSAHASFDFL